MQKIRTRLLVIRRRFANFANTAVINFKLINDVHGHNVGDQVFSAKDQQYPFSISLGYVHYPQQAISVADVLPPADQEWRQRQDFQQEPAGGRFSLWQGLLRHLILAKGL